MTTTLTQGSPSALQAARHRVRRSLQFPAQDRRLQPWLSRGALGLAATRVALGFVALAFPEPAGRAWIGKGATGRDRAVLLRALGGRDVALGAGALIALRSGRDAKRWLAMGATSDLVDTAASAAGFGALPKWRRFLVLVASGGAACAGIVLAANLPSPS